MISSRPNALYGARVRNFVGSGERDTRKPGLAGPAAGGERCSADRPGRRATSAVPLGSALLLGVVALSWLGCDSSDEEDGGDAAAMGGADVGGEDARELPEIKQVFADEVQVADALFGVDITDDGAIYVSGETSVDGDPAVAVARYLPGGELDTSFGEDGIVALNTLEEADDDPDAGEPGAESSSAVAAMPDGGLAVVITRNDGALVREVVVVRLDAAGELDPGFGDEGVAWVPMTDWAVGDAWSDAGGRAEPESSAYDLVLDTSASDDRLVVFGSAAARMGTGRVDEDRYVVRLHAGDGSVDADFGDEGIFSIDLGEKKGPDGSRRGYVMDDGSIVSSGYTFYESVLHHIFLLHLDADGEPVTDFGFADADSDCNTEQDGVICINPFIGEGFAEAYAVAVQDDGKMITTGYGQPARGSGSGTDLVSFRFDGASLDASYGVAGGVIQDSGTEDRGRDLEVLPDGRVVHVGTLGGVAAMYFPGADGALWEGVGEGGVVDFPDNDGNLRGLAVHDGMIATVGDGPGAFLAIFEIEESP